MNRRHSSHHKLDLHNPDPNPIRYLVDQPQKVDQKLPRLYINILDSVAEAPLRQRDHRIQQPRLYKNYDSNQKIGYQAESS
jgi:hypothetical protein